MQYTSVTDPWHLGTDPDRALFVSYLQDTNKNNFFSRFFLLITFKDTFPSRWKVTKKSRNNKNKEFSYQFCLMMDGCGFESGPVPYLWLTDLDLGVPKSYGSGTLQFFLSLFLKCVNVLKHVFRVALLAAGSWFIALLTSLAVVLDPHVRQ